MYPPLHVFSCFDCPPLIPSISIHKFAPAPQLLELTLGLYWWPLGKAAVAPSRAACHTTSAAALAGSTRHCKAATARRHNALEA